MANKTIIFCCCFQFPPSTTKTHTHRQVSVFVVQKKRGGGEKINKKGCSISFTR